MEKQDPRRNRILVALDWHGTIDGILFGGDDYEIDYFNEFDAMTQKPKFMTVISEMERKHNAQVDFCIITGGSADEESNFSISSGMRNLRSVFERWGMKDKFKYLVTRSHKFLFKVNNSEEAERTGKFSRIIKLDESMTRVLDGKEVPKTKRDGIENIFSFFPTRKEVDDLFVDPLNNINMLKISQLAEISDEDQLRLFGGDMCEEQLLELKAKIGTQEDYKMIIVGGNDKVQDYCMIDAEVRAPGSESNVPVVFVSNRALDGKFKNVDPEHKARIFTNSAKNHLGIGYAMIAVNNSELMKSIFNRAQISDEAQALFDKYYEGSDAQADAANGEAQASQPKGGTDTPTE